jgi:hypothetical protein
MTEVERKLYRKLSLHFFLKFMAIITLCDTLPFLGSSYNHIWHLTALILGFLIAIPLIVRQQKALTRFLLSTEYARKRGLKTI